jgi:putative ABC transport system ATP-binding protein
MMATVIEADHHDEAGAAGHGRSDGHGGGHGHGHGGHGHGKTPIRRLIDLLRLEWTDVFTLLAFALGVGILSLVAPAAIEALVNTVAFGILLWPVFVLAAVMFALLFVAAVLRAMQTFVAECLQRRLFVRTALGFADRLARTDLASFDGTNRADLVNRFFEVSSGQKSIATLLVEGVGIIMMTLVGLVVLASYHPYLLTFALVLAGLVVFLLFVLGIGGVRTSISESLAKFDVAAWLEEVARCPHTFRSGAGAALALERADLLSDRYVGARRRHFAIVWRQTLFALLVEAVGSTVLLGLGGWLVINRQLTLGQLVASELIVTLVLGSLSKIGKYLEIFYDLQATLDKLGVIDRLPPEPSGGELLAVDGGPLAAVVEIPAPGGDVRRLDLLPGERLGIVGPRGKTQLLEYLALLRVPPAGLLTFDGLDARSLDRRAVRQHISYIGRPEVFEGSVIENVRLGRSDLTALDVRRALDMVGLVDRVARLPDGIETMLTPEGRPLSSNEISRLAIARALVGRPRLLLLDGMLDGLDIEACPELLDALFDPTAPWTLVVVSARQDIRARCTRIVEWT